LRTAINKGRAQILLGPVEPIRFGLLAFAILAFVLEPLQVRWSDRMISVIADQFPATIVFFPQVPAAGPVLICTSCGRHILEVVAVVVTHPWFGLYRPVKAVL